MKLRPRQFTREEMDDWQLTKTRPIYLMADTYQACVINSLLPKGFKFELQDSVLKNVLQKEKQQKE